MIYARHINLKRFLLVMEPGKDNQVERDKLMLLDQREITMELSPQTATYFTVSRNRPYQTRHISPR